MTVSFEDFIAYSIKVLENMSVGSYHIHSNNDWSVQRVNKHVYVARQGKPRTLKLITHTYVDKLRKQFQ